MMLERAHTLLERISRLTAIVAGYTLTALAIGICVEIVLRRAIGFSLQGTDEMGGYVLAGASAFGFGYALMHRAHTRIDLLFRRVPTSAQAALNLLSAGLFAAVAVFMAWRAYDTWERTIQFGAVAPTPLQTPIWIPQGIWFSGLAFFALIAVFLLVRGIAALSEGAVAINSLIGPVSLDQEIEEEVGRSEPDRR